MTILKNYFKKLYSRTMAKAYGLAENEIVEALREGGFCLDCGANAGQKYSFLQSKIGLDKNRYYGLEWNESAVKKAKNDGLQVSQQDLNSGINFESETFSCVFALSVIEHLINPCRFMKESYRVLHKGGKMIILTPNISTYFTALMIVCGKMPSSGPHPDSDSLIYEEEIFKVRSESITIDCENDTPVHRHLVVFSYRVLKKYLNMVGFSKVKGYGFGLYPFPNFTQCLFEKIDPYHCHQMVFVAEK